VNLVASIGQLLGPVLAGVVASRSVALALVMAAAVALVWMLPPLALDPLPPFAPPKDRPKGLIWRRPGVDAGCWASLTAGAWRGLLSSYVPVALDRAGQSLPLIGVPVSAANGANIAGAALVARVRGGTLVRAMTISVVASGAGVALVALVALLAGSAPFAALVLAASGLGAGALQTLGPALASDMVHPRERGDAIAATSTFRAAALFASPLAVAGLLSGIALGPAMLIAGLLITLPALTTRALQRAAGRRGRGGGGGRRGMTVPETWPTSAPPDREAEKSSRPAAGGRAAGRAVRGARAAGGAGRPAGPSRAGLERSSKRNGRNFPPRRGKLNLSRLSPNLPVAKAG
jgi:hypothetical protein